MLSEDALLWGTEPGHLGARRASLRCPGHVLWQVPGEETGFPAPVIIYLLLDFAVLGLSPGTLCH